jgi:hypothetical protein
MTCRVHGIYLKFGSFNDIDPIVPKKNRRSVFFSSKRLLTVAGSAGAWRLRGGGGHPRAEAAFMTPPQRRHRIQQ